MGEKKRKERREEKKKKKRKINIIVLGNQLVRKYN